MKLRRAWVIGGIAALVLITAGIGVRAGQASRGRPTAVAVVEVTKVFDSLREKAEIEGAFTREQEKLQTDKQAKEQEINDLKAALEILNVSSPDYKKKQDEYEHKAFELRAWEEWQQNRMMRESRLQSAALYSKILDAIAKIAKNSNFDVVLFKEGTPDFTGLKTEDIVPMIRSRKVLYAADDLDLTDQVTQLMNNEYTNSVGGAPAK